MKIAITGTRTGIGKAIARTLCESGYEVWGVSRSAQKSLEAEWSALGYRFRSSLCDVGVWADVSAFQAEVRAAWGHIDALICCAGSQPPIGAAMTVDPVAWSQNIRLNLDGTFYSIRAFHELLLKAPQRARVICFSGGGSTAPRPNFSAYACAKSGIVRLIETLAEEWRDAAIDINTIAPGAIHTAMSEQILTLGEEVVGQKEFAQAVQQMARGDAPLEKVLGLVNFLLSPDSNGITGKLISAQWDPWESLHRHLEDLQKTDVYTLRRITPKDRGMTWDPKAGL